MRMTVHSDAKLPHASFTHAYPWSNVQIVSLVTRTLVLSELGCGKHVRVTIKCGSPFVGKTLAEFVAKDCECIIAGDYVYISERLEQA